MAYRWILFLHVASSFMFMMAHGATAAVMFHVKSDLSSERLQTLLDIRHWAEIPFNIATILMFLSGIALAFVGGWWRAGWIWASLGLLLLITIAMALLGRGYLDSVAGSIEVTAGSNGKASSTQDQIAPDLGLIVQNGKPGLLAAIGILGFLGIVWLMMFKPF